jgi:Uma2 family endonuclease
VSLQTHRFTVEDFHRMIRAGILKADDRVELVEGELVEMTPIGPAHSACVRNLDGIFQRAAEGRFIVSIQNAVQLGEHSEAYPDLALLRPRSDSYATQHPSPTDVLLVIEVSDTTLEYDRGQKLALYARAGIPEVWIVDLEHAQVESHRAPSEGIYRTIHLHRRGDRFEPATLPGLAVPAADILP